MPWDKVRVRQKTGDSQTIMNVHRPPHFNNGFNGVLMEIRLLLCLGKRAVCVAPLGLLIILPV